MMRREFQRHVSEDLEGILDRDESFREGGGSVECGAALWTNLTLFPRKGRLDVSAVELIEIFLRFQADKKSGV